MKKILLSLLFLLSASMLFAQHREQRELTSFDGIRFAGRGSLYISAGEQSRLELEASDPAALPRILTRVEGGTLHIEYMRDEDKILDVHPRISVYLTYEQLRSIRTEGIVNVYTEDAIRNGSFFFKAEGVGKNELLLEVENLE
ncbi:MAG: GIN domain-containing protein, partial [Cyclobacteriaceae bacterium]